MREKHLQIGSKEEFDKFLIKIGVFKGSEKSKGLVAMMYGMKVIENPLIPTHLAHLVDEDGRLLQTFNLRT